MRVAMALVATLTLTSLARGGEVDKEKLRALVELPKKSVSFRVQFDREKGLRWDLGEDKKEKESPDPKAKIEQLREELVGDASDAKRYHELANLYRETNNDKGAAEARKQAIDLRELQLKANPADSDLRCRLAMVLWEDRQLEAAEKEYRCAIELQPKDSNLWMALAVFYQIRALEFLAGSPLWPSDDVFESFAKTVFGSNRKPSAEEDQTALRALVESLRCCDEAVKARPKEFIGHFWRGWVQLTSLMVRQEFQDLPQKQVDKEAGELFKKMLRDSVQIARQMAKDCPESPLAIGLAACAEIVNGLLENEAAWKDVKSPAEVWKKVSPESRKAVAEGMAKLLVLTSHNDRHIAADAREILGALHCLTGEFDEGEKHLRQALLLEPQREFSWWILEVITAENKPKEAMLKLSQEHTKAKDTPQNRLILADAYQRLCKFDDAIAVLEPLILTEPKDYKIPWALAALHLKRSNNDDDGKNAHRYLEMACLRAKLSEVPDEGLLDLYTTAAVYNALADHVDNSRQDLKAILVKDENHKYAKRVLEALGEEK